MYICICHKVTDKEIRESLRRGSPPKDILKRLKVGDSCGICLNEAVKEIETELMSKESSRQIKTSN